MELQGSNAGVSLRVATLSTEAILFGAGLPTSIGGMGIDFDPCFVSILGFQCFGSRV